jgi:hypothetical protein
VRGRIFANFAAIGSVPRYRLALSNNSQAPTKTNNSGHHRDNACGAMIPFCSNNSTTPITISTSGPIAPQRRRCLLRSLSNGLPSFGRKDNSTRAVGGERRHSLAVLPAGAL